MLKKRFQTPRWRFVGEVGQFSVMRNTTVVHEQKERRPVWLLSAVGDASPPAWRSGSDNIEHKVTCDAIFSRVTTYVVNLNDSSQKESMDFCGEEIWTEETARADATEGVTPPGALRRCLRRVSALRVERGFGFFQQLDGGSSFKREQMGNKRFRYRRCRDERWKKRRAFVRKDEDVVSVEVER